MWCLETIVAVNEAAAKRAKKGESELLAYKDVGINSVKKLYQFSKEQRSLG